MRIPGLKTAKQTALRLAGRWRSVGAILGYHRVSDDPWDPFGINVRVSHFREHLEVLARRARLVTVEELIERRRRPDTDRRAIALTFDDAYRECLTVVSPSLEPLAAPATVFAVSGLLGQEPWWERLARALASSRAVEGAVELIVAGRRHLLAASAAADPTERKALVLEAYRRLADAQPSARIEALDRLCATLGIEREEGIHRCLSGAELRQLIGSGRVEVGAHGEEHVELGRLPAAAQRRDIGQSKRVLEDVLGVAVRGFSYPHGSSDSSTAELVHREGFRYACSSRPGPVFRGSDVYHLPRVWPPDVGGTGFSRWLDGWIGS